MTRDEGKTWLLELTQSITRGLEASREDRAKLWEAIAEIKTGHMNCREQVLKNLHDLDKRTEIMAVKIGIYVAVISSVVALVAQEIISEVLH